MNPTTPPQPGSPQAPQAPQALLIGLLIAGALLCALAFWAGANWNTWMQKQTQKPAPGYVVTGDAQIPDDESEVPEVVEPQVEEFDHLDVLPPVETWIDVSWYPVEQQTFVSREPDPSRGEQMFDDAGYWPKMFTLGTVSSGPFASQRLVLTMTYSPGLGECCQEFSYELQGADGQITRLGRYESAFGFGDIAGTTGVAIDVNATLGIEELEFDPVIAHDTQGRGYVRMGPGGRVGYLTEISGDSREDVVESGLVATLQDGSELFAANNIFFGVREDGRLEWYDTQIPFLDGLDQPASERTAFTPNVYLNDIRQVYSTYLKGDLGGCGFRTMTHVQTEDVIGEMKVVGYYVEGERVDLYAPVDLTREYYQGYFATWQGMNPEGTLEDFERLVPFFYWKDDHGRWIEFMNSEVVPAAECGKPVIYLYPEETTDVSVKLWPKGGFTVTEPAYNGGWNVTASPDGTLVNKADGLTYPYLFWEGRGGLYSEPTRYWVVAREDVHAFLVDTLAELGLNEKETADFLEFWEPRMQESAYYKIGFHGTQVMDQIAPMRVSGGPDTIVRILMDYTELDAWAPSLPPSLPPTPVREGFTVIEWGGVLR